MKFTVLALLMLCNTTILFAQKNTHQLLDLALTAGSSRGSVAGSYVYNWQLGAKKKFEIGLGARLTTAFGTKQEYTTAPARLARTNTIPFAIVFAGQNTVNWDTLTVQRPLVASLNATINLGYNFNSRWSGGFNIDLIGFSAGRKSAAILVSNGITRTEPSAKPSAFNLLLTGDLDYGSLNSEFYLKYNWNDKWGIRGVYQFQFNEYKTTTIKQTAPDGTLVDRFRSKANNVGIGISYHF